LLKLSPLVDCRVGHRAYRYCRAGRAAGVLFFTTGLTIASLVYGPMLGAFLLGVLTKRANQIGVMVGMASSILIMSVNLVQDADRLDVVRALGTVACVTIGYTVSLLAPHSVAE